MNFKWRGSEGKVIEKRWEAWREVKKKWWESELYVNGKWLERWRSVKVKWWESVKGRGIMDKFGEFRVKREGKSDGKWIILGNGIYLYLQVWNFRTGSAGSLLSVSESVPQTSSKNRNNSPSNIKTLRGRQVVLKFRKGMSYKAKKTVVER